MYDRKLEDIGNEHENVNSQNTAIWYDYHILLTMFVYFAQSLG